MTLSDAQTYLEEARRAAAADPCPRTEAVVRMWRRIVEQKTLKPEALTRPA
jgi:hypothetical protein